MIFNQLRREVKIDGVWLDVHAAGIAGFPLREDTRIFQGHLIRTLTVCNQSGRTAALGGFRWRCTAGDEGITSVPGPRVRLYLEGWSMAAPCGVRKYGDCDFTYNPDYLQFAVCAPREYRAGVPNQFRAEHLFVWNDTEGGNNVLVGFLTTARQFGRFQLTLSGAGLSAGMISECDDCALDPGASVESEEMVFLSGPAPHLLLTQFADLLGRRMNARRSFRAPRGWCSWYYYFEKVCESDIRENVQFLSAHRKEYPVEYIQLDDGYQTALGDWLSCNERFPGGLRNLAQEIRTAGFKPGLWLAPFQVEDNSELLRRHPEWMLHDANGKTLFPACWREGHRVAVLDGSHPEVQNYFRSLFHTLRDWGFEYVKLDFLVQGAGYDPDAVRFDPHATRASALRAGMQAIRDGFGDDRFILGCTAPFGPMIGLVDGERIATDITPYWSAEGDAMFQEAPAVPNVCRNGILHAYMNHRLWINDPDTHIARRDHNRLTDSEVLLWSSSLRFTGGMMLSGDRLSTLAPDRACLAQTLMQNPDCRESRPLDLLERVCPEIWLGVHRHSGERLLGVFRFEDSDGEIMLKPEYFDGKAIILEDEESGSCYRMENEPVVLIVDAHSARIFRIHSAR